MKQVALLIDDDPSCLTLGEKLLLPFLPDIQIIVANTPQRAIEQIQAYHPAVIVLDLCLDSTSGVQGGFSLLAECLKLDSTMRIILMTGYDDQDYGIRAIRMGAASFLSKPVSYSHLAALIIDGLQQSSLKRKYQHITKSKEFKLAENIFGPSSFNKKLLDALTFATKNNQSILITGETGTGKGFCAELIHKFSERSEQKFVRLQPFFSNFDIVASELFGHQKGSFTGANITRLGLLKEADQGTLFLDEIDAFPPEVQVSLLGVLQSKKFRAIGSNYEQDSDFRLISASNQSMEYLLEQQKFRPDLYYRIAGFKIELIPLRERKEDLEDLSSSFLSCNYYLSSSALAKLISYDWPGNVRELGNVLINAKSLAESAGRQEILSEDLTFWTLNQKSCHLSFQEKVQEFKSKLVREALLRHSNSQAKTARFLGIDRATLRSIIDS